MFNKFRVYLTVLIFSLFAVQSFAISPGAGQAQVRNNMQTIEQNKRQMQQHQQQMQNHPQVQKKVKKPSVDLPH